MDPALQHLGRGVYTATVWLRLEECPTCGAKTGERCVRDSGVYSRVCMKPHRNRSYLPQYRRIRSK